MNLELKVGTTGRVRATVTDETGVGVDDAELELQLLQGQQAVTPVIVPALLGGGVYQAYLNTVASPIALEAGQRLRLRVDVIAGNLQALAEPIVDVVRDED